MDTLLIIKAPWQLWMVCYSSKKWLFWYSVQYTANTGNGYQLQFIKIEAVTVPSPLSKTRWEAFEAFAFLGWRSIFKMRQKIYRIQMSLGSGLWVPVSLTTRAFWNFADVTLADDDTNPILADDANRAIWRWCSSFRCWWSSKMEMPNED